VVLLGRLGLETARVPHVDRHGLVWLERGQLHVEDGCLRFRAAGSSMMAAGDYAIPFQALSLVLLGPGGSVTHDALRLLARHGTGLVAVGEGGVRLYSAPQLGPDDSQLARRQARLWADPDARTGIARRMFAWRFGEVLPHGSADVLRGIEGARIKESYRLLAQKHRVPWEGRRYDRATRARRMRRTRRSTMPRPASRARR
jgi:CRISPR-associated protein Cas1